MDLTSPRIIKEILTAHQTKPTKRMGQNFLIDKRALSKIVAAAQLTPNDTIIEVGPGLGTLTAQLAPRAKKVIAIEKDRAMLVILEETLKEYDNIEIIQGDILKISNFKFQISNYKVVANIPYYLTSPLIRKFLEDKNPPKEMVLMVQKEVAQRICAKPPHMSLLAVAVQFYAKANVLFYVSKGSFWPAPKVDSAVIKITPQQKNRDRDSIFPEVFFRVVKAGFSQPRKQLANNLSKVLKKSREEVTIWLQAHRIQPTQRAETLSLENWLVLTKSLDKGS